MQATEYEQWLRDTRAFWDVVDEKTARFGRVCSSPEIEEACDPEALERIWERETQAAIDRILEGVPIAGDWQCLEIGCGVGRLMKALAGRCGRVSGVDLSERMLEHAREYLAGTGNASLHLNDGRSLGMIPDASIDFVYSHLAFQHMTLYAVVDAYLAEIARVLRPGGYCRIQNWREGPLPVVERVKNVIRRWAGREVLRSNRCWQWREGKCVRFGGVTFTPAGWRGRLRRFGLVPVRVEVGVGHEYWMWTTCRRPAAGRSTAGKA